MILIQLILFALIGAFLVAKLEIQIEGPNGWAAKLPTWKISNRLTRFLFGLAPLTGYHVYFFSSILFLMHFIFFFGFPWTPINELRVIFTLVLLLLAEDFLWFILNPSFGWKKFKPQYIPWQSQWLWKFPLRYYLGVIFLIILFVICYA